MLASSFVGWVGVRARLRSGDTLPGVCSPNRIVGSKTPSLCMVLMNQSDYLNILDTVAICCFMFISIISSSS